MGLCSGALLAIGQPPKSCLDAPTVCTVLFDKLFPFVDIINIMHERVWQFQSRITIWFRIMSWSIYPLWLKLPPHSSFMLICFLIHVLIHSYCCQFMFFCSDRIKYSQNQDVFTTDLVYCVAEMNYSKTCSRWPHQQIDESRTTVLWTELWPVHLPCFWN